MDGLCKAGRVHTARDLLLLLENTIYKPDVMAYNAVINGLCKCRMVDNALQLKSRMIDKGISPTVVTYSSMIQGLCDFDGYCLQGKMDRAKEVFDSITGSGLTPCIISYNSLINGYCKKGKVDEAWRLFLEVSSKDLEQTTVTYNTMIHGLLKADLLMDGNFIRIWKLGKYIPVCNLIVKRIPSKGSLCREGCVDEAKNLLVKMERSGCAPDSVMYNNIIQATKNGSQGRKEGGRRRREEEEDKEERGDVKDRHLQCVEAAYAREVRSATIDPTLEGKIARLAHLRSLFDATNTFIESNPSV
ncbi:hypothetical protein MIMGU_mgv11b018047mg [Erythranthe guttata]|uniref:Pentatricopeptide repeat-containing protein n=1 Tax=Erythranthe guttata TaxID=4155 RepID=A0A022RLX4_ERYGU|nr:hypothetical protein MIMGU_mgv11b018047mg [Erythranthe guttata]